MDGSTLSDAPGGKDEAGTEAVRPSPRVDRGRSEATRWRRVALSERDWEILTWAHEQKFLAFEQVARWFPEGAPNPYVRPKDEPTTGTLRRRARPGSWYVAERLRKLVRFEVLRRVPVFTEAAAALLPGRVGIELLEGTGRGHGLPRLDGIDWKNFVHDRAATDVRWVVEKQLGGRWRSERVLRRDLDCRHVPDALVEFGGRSIAVEVELTRKSTARYLRILQRYAAAPPFAADLVLYIVPGKKDLAHLFSVVLPAALAARDLWGGVTPDLSRFRFTTLSALPERKVWWTASNPSTPTGGTL
jgi:hypothetical protein